MFLIRFIIDADVGCGCLILSKLLNIQIAVTKYPWVSCMVALDCIWLYSKSAIGLKSLAESMAYLLHWVVKKLDSKRKNKKKIILRVLEQSWSFLPNIIYLFMIWKTPKGTPEHRCIGWKTTQIPDGCVGSRKNHCMCLNESLG